MKTDTFEEQEGFPCPQPRLTKVKDLPDQRVPLFKLPEEISLAQHSWETITVELEGDITPEDPTTKTAPNVSKVADSCRTEKKTGPILCNKQHFSKKVKQTD